MNATNNQRNQNEVGAASERLRLLVVTVGGLGLIRKAPGTWGSIPAAAICFLMLAFGAGATVYLAVTVALCLAASGLCVALTPWAERRFKKTDPRAIVLDEVAGQCVALLPAPMALIDGRPFPALVFVLIGFALFRLLDITKPGFIDAAQRLPRGWGVLIDDLLAGAGAAGLLWVGWKIAA